VFLEHSLERARADLFGGVAGGDGEEAMWHIAQILKLLLAGCLLIAVVLRAACLKLGYLLRGKENER